MSNESQPERNQSADNESDSNEFDVDIINDDIENDAGDRENLSSAVFFENLLRNQCDTFVSKIYCKPGLPRNIVQEIINDTENFLSLDGFMDI